jgi:hypothetical protein
MQVHKSGGEEDPSNYRPISILLTISKILEKAIHTQLSSYLDDNQLLTTNQCGFRLNSSTVTAMAKFTDNVLKSMDDGELTGAIFLDLAKAFDTVNHGSTGGSVKKGRGSGLHLQKDKRLYMQPSVELSGTFHRQGRASHHA